MSELFEVEESLSPWEQWRQEYKIETRWSISWRRFFAWSEEFQGDENLGEADTEEEAISHLVGKIDIPSFSEWKMMKGGRNA